MFCQNCGKSISGLAAACPECGHPCKAAVLNPSPKSKTAAILLCLFLGGFGIHRFYVGKIGTGILMLLTLGLFGLWTLIDLIIIICGNFKDAEGRVVS